MMSYDVVVFACVSHQEMDCVTWYSIDTRSPTPPRVLQLFNSSLHKTNIIHFAKPERPRFCHLQFCLQADVRGSNMNMASKKLVANDIPTWRFAYLSLRHQDLQIIMLGQQSVTEMQYSWTSLETSVFGKGWKGKMVENSLGLYFLFWVIYWKIFGWFSFDWFAMGDKKWRGVDRGKGEIFQ